MDGGKVADGKAGKHGSGSGNGANGSLPKACCWRDAPRATAMKNRLVGIGIGQAIMFKGWLGRRRPAEETRSILPPRWIPTYHRQEKLKISPDHSKEEDSPARGTVNGSRYTGIGLENIN